MVELNRLLLFNLWPNCELLSENLSVFKTLEKSPTSYVWSLSVLLSVLYFSDVFSHGDVAPQAVDTSHLPELDEEWLDQNPWRDPQGDTWQLAINVGASGYNQNCARCHGLEAVSGGLAPDLRLLSADLDGDEWYVERFRNGATQNGVTKMPAFEDILNQQAAWAIRTYVETRPEDEAFKDHNTRLIEIRDSLKAMAKVVANGSIPEELSIEAENMQKELTDFNGSVKTASGAPNVESAVSRAAIALDGTAESFAKAAELLSIGLSAAK